MSPLRLTVRKLHLHMVALFKKAVETLGAGTLLKEMGDWWPTLKL